jgi:cytochrome c oxidase subunit 2
MRLKLILLASFCLGMISQNSLAQDLEAGRVLYGTCAACHGPNGEGLEALNAPKIAGQQSWYTIRQLNNFKNGVRGADSRDVYGQQMAPMAQILTTEEAIRNVAAYIATLGN